MINISTSKQLGIILPNMNKALAQVLSTATPDEIETITKGKDLKSVMGSILKQTSSASDKDLLQLVKNNPTLKNLGEVSTTMKDLVSSLKSDKQELPIEKVLKNFLNDVKDLKNSEFKQKLENSGVFLESRLKNATNPQVDLKNALSSLIKVLEQSNIPNTKNILNEAKELLNTKILKSATNADIVNKTNDNPKQLQQLSSSVEALLSKLKTSLKSADTIHNPALAKAIEKLEHQFDIKGAKNPQIDLRNALSSLTKILEQSNIPNTKEIINESKLLLSNNNPKELSSSVEALLSKLKTSLKSADTIQNPTLTKAIEKLENQLTIKSEVPNELKNTKNTTNPQVDLKNTLISLTKTLEQSNIPHNRSIVSEAKTLLNTDLLKSATNTDIANKVNENPKQLQQLSTSLEALVSKIKTSLKGTDTTHNPALAKALEKLEQQFELKNTTTQELKNSTASNSLDELKKQMQVHEKLEVKTLSVENFKLSAIQESLTQVSSHVNKSFTLESKGIMESLEKIFQALKNVEQTTTTASSAINKLLELGTPKDILQLSQKIKDVILKADPIFSKDTATIVSKLENLVTAQQLNPQNNIKDILSNDLKALLLHAGDEMSKSSHPNQTEVLKHIDKLSLQIDYHQLLSHLSNGTSLYLPFSWDMMQEGNITMKKDNDEKFYCDIDLKLKEYGDLNLRLTLFDKNQLNLHIYSSSDKFKKLVQENLPDLRSALIDAQITPREIRIFEPKAQTPTSPYNTQEDNIYMGFEVKG